MRHSSAHAGDALWLPRARKWHGEGGALFSEFVDLMYIGGGSVPAPIGLSSTVRATSNRLDGPTCCPAYSRSIRHRMVTPLLRLAVQIQLGEPVTSGIHRALKYKQT